MRRPLLLVLLSSALVLGRVAGFRPPVPAPAPLIIRGIPSLPSSFAPPAPAAVRAGFVTTRRRHPFTNQLPPLASSSLAAADPPSDDGDAAAKEAEEERQQAVPSLAALLRFTIPTLGIWLAGPIMSLVRVCREWGSGGCLGGDPMIGRSIDPWSEWTNDPFLGKNPSATPLLSFHTYIYAIHHQ